MTADWTTRAERTVAAMRARGWVAGVPELLLGMAAEISRLSAKVEAPGRVDQVLAERDRALAELQRLKAAAKRIESAEWAEVPAAGDRPPSGGSSAGVVGMRAGLSPAVPGGSARAAGGFSDGSESDARAR